MRKRHSGLLATAAAAALVFGLAGSASAFEVVDWNWTANVVEDWDIDVKIEVDYDPTGIVKIEKLQMHFGDINSFAKVFGIENNPPTGGTEGGTVLIDETFLFDPVNYNAVNGNFPCDQNAAEGPCSLIDQAGVGDGDSPISTTLLGNPNGDINENDNLLQFSVRVTGEVDVPASAGFSIDGLALPEVVNAATSVANNQQIYSTSALKLHDAQIAAGDINAIGGGETPDPIAFLIAAYALTLVDDQLDGINEHTDLAVLTILGAATGFIEPADIDADAWAFGITNASVNNSATAVGNNASYEIDTDNAANAIMVADLTQLLIGDVNAVALAGGIEVNNYDLTTFEGPLVKNVATAVGNNLNIRVDGCGGCVADTGGSNTGGN